MKEKSAAKKAPASAVVAYRRTATRRAALRCWRRAAKAENCGGGSATATAWWRGGVSSKGGARLYIFYHLVQSSLWCFAWLGVRLTLLRLPRWQCEYLAWRGGDIERHRRSGGKSAGNGAGVAKKRNPASARISVAGEGGIIGENHHRLRCACVALSHLSIKTVVSAWWRRRIGAATEAA